MKPKLGPFLAIIDAILAEDKVRPKKQQHTSNRIFERLRNEHGFTGGITIVKDYVAPCRQRSQGMFVAGAPAGARPPHKTVSWVRAPSASRRASESLRSKGSPHTWPLAHSSKPMF